MAQVSVRVNGYSYILSCADGQEDHLRALTADIDRRIDGIKVAAGPSGEARLLLMAALVLSDELYELRKLMGHPDLLPVPEPVARPEPKTARRLTRLARRAEAIADTAEQAAAQEGTPDFARTVAEDSLPEHRGANGAAPGDAMPGQNEGPDDAPSGDTRPEDAHPGDSRPDDTRGETIAARPEHP